MSTSAAVSARYRGRLAPSPTGLLHLGHARSFWKAQDRAQAAKGVLVLRNEDLDRSRCRSEFVSAMYEDLEWFGLRWQEGPDIGGPFAPYSQSERGDLYRAALRQLQTGGFVYPCRCSRQDVLRALQAPHVADEEPIYPGTCRPKRDAQFAAAAEQPQRDAETRVNWRFQVPDGETISFLYRN